MDSPVVDRRPFPLGETTLGDPVDQFHRRVMLDLERLGQIADRRRLRTDVSAHSDQELVLFGCQPCPTGGVVAKAVKPAETGAECGEGLKILVRERCI
jgi:hypothetical protein